MANSKFKYRDTKKDNEAALFNIQGPKGIERRHVEGATVTFSASLINHTRYRLMNESNDSIVFYTTDNTAPVIAYDSGSNYGNPIAPFEKGEIFYLDSSESPKTLKVICSGSANVTLIQYFE